MIFFMVHKVLVDIFIKLRHPAGSFETNAKRRVWLYEPGNLMCEKVKKMKKRRLSFYVLKKIMLYLQIVIYNL